MTAIKDIVKSVIKRRADKKQYLAFENDPARMVMQGDCQPLLEALLEDKIQWGPGKYEAMSLGGNFLTENDMYFYFTVGSKSIANLADRLTATRIECAGVRSAKIGTPLPDQFILEEMV